MKKDRSRSGRGTRITVTEAEPRETENRDIVAVAERGRR